MFHARVESRHSSSTRFVLGRRCSTGTWVSVTFSVALLMTFQVQGQVIRTWKTAIAMNTFERLGTSVFAIMASQFVTSGESPLTSFPRTLVRLLTCKKTKKKFHSFHPKEYNGKGYVIWSFSFLKISSSSRNQQRGKVSGRTCATTSLFAAKKELAACQNWPAWRLRTTGNSMSHPPLVSMPLVAIEQDDHIDRQKMDNGRIDFSFFFLANDVGLHDGQDQQVSTPSVGLWIDGRSSAKASREPVPFAIQMNHRWRHLPPRTEFSLADELTNRRRSRSADKSDGTLPILCRGRHIPSRSLPSPAAGLWLCQCLN